MNSNKKLYKGEMAIDEPEYSLYQRNYGITKTFSDYRRAKNNHLAWLLFLHAYPNNEVISVELVPLEEKEVSIQGKFDL